MPEAKDPSQDRRHGASEIVRIPSDEYRSLLDAERERDELAALIDSGDEKVDETERLLARPDRERLLAEIRLADEMFGHLKVLTPDDA